MNILKEYLLEVKRQTTLDREDTERMEYKLASQKLNAGKRKVAQSHKDENGKWSKKISDNYARQKINHGMSDGSDRSWKDED